MKSLLGILFFSLFLVLPYSSVLAGKSLTEKQALDILAKQIQKDKLYVNRINFSCLSFLTEDKVKKYFDFVINEKHGGKCPGDPATSPTVDRFRVDRLTKKIKKYDLVKEEFYPYGMSSYP